MTTDLDNDLLKRAIAGDARAQLEMAEQLRTAEPPDYEAALDWYRRAAEQGDKVAQNNLGSMYQRGLGVKADQTEAALWYRRAAEQGEKVAQYNLATRYRVGKGVALDLAESVRWLSLSAEQGYVEAIADLGAAYSLGRGVARDIFAAAQLLLLAADQGDAIAVRNLGELFVELAPLAKQGDSLAQYYVGMLHSRGFGVPQDKVLGHAWVALAAAGSEDEDKAHVQNSLRALESSMATEDLNQAANQLRQLRADFDIADPAAELSPSAQGDPDALVALAHRYLNGIDVEIDEAKAVDLLRRACVQGGGHPGASRELGDLYRIGRGVERNIAAAADYHVIAARGGDDSAKESLADYREELETAALDGSVVACDCLMTLYNLGLVVEKDLNLAYGWACYGKKWANPVFPEEASYLEDLEQFVQFAEQFLAEDERRNAEQSVVDKGARRTTRQSRPHRTELH